MSQSFIAILIASLLGSPHCGAMCGGFAGLYVKPNRSPFIQHSLYHSGRLITYLILGFAAGIVGHSLDSASGLIGFQRLASIIVGLLLVGIGVKRLFNIKSPALLTSGIFKLLTVPLHRLLHQQSKHPVPAYPFLIGLVSTLLPCGWLYGYLAIAASSGSPTTAMLIMACFWIGTVPILLGIGLGLHKALPLGERYFPTIASVLLIVAGFFSLSGHLNSSAAPEGCSHHMTQSAVEDPSATENSSEAETPGAANTGGSDGHHSAAGHHGVTGQ